jgi:hypothetical protein
MNIPKIEEAITLLYQTYIQDQDVATQRGIAITAMNEMVKLLGGEDVVKKIEAVPYSARLRAQNLFEDKPTWVELTDEEMLMIYGQQHEGKKYSLGRMVQEKLKDKNT